MSQDTVKTHRATAWLCGIAVAVTLATTLTAVPTATASVDALPSGQLDPDVRKLAIASALSIIGGGLIVVYALTRAAASLVDRAIRQRTGESASVTARIAVDCTAICLAALAFSRMAIPAFVSGWATLAATGIAIACAYSILRALPGVTVTRASMIVLCFGVAFAALVMTWRPGL